MASTPITYSFEDVNAAIVGPGGAFDITGGTSDEGITVAWAEDRNLKTMAADGTWMHSLRMDQSGEITIRLLKNSPTNAYFSEMFNLQTRNSALHGQNVITITSPQLGDLISCVGVAFRRAPTITYGKDGGVQEWTFDAGAINELLALATI